MRSFLSPTPILLAALFLSPLTAQEKAPPPHRLAKAAISTFDDASRKDLLKPIDDPSRTDWHYIPKDSRKGVVVSAMNEAQKKATFALLQSSMSPAGYQTARDVMELEAVLRFLENAPERRDPEKYYLTIFGKPSKLGTWGYSFEGHHLSLNFAYENGELKSATPMFFAGNPDEVVKTDNGLPKVGTRVLAALQDEALALLKSLDAAQQKKTIQGKPDRDMKEGGKAQAVERRRIGIAEADMNAAQKQQLWALIDAYLAYLPTAAAEKIRGEMKDAGAEKIAFAWHGSDDLDKPHRYQVVGPTFAIVYYNTQGDSVKTPANHSHAILRSIDHDFGK